MKTVSFIQNDAHVAQIMVWRLGMVSQLLTRIARNTILFTTGYMAYVFPAEMGRVISANDLPLKTAPEGNKNKYEDACLDDFRLRGGCICSKQWVTDSQGR